MTSSKQDRNSARVNFCQVWGFSSVLSKRMDRQDIEFCQNSYLQLINHHLLQL